MPLAYKKVLIYFVHDVKESVEAPFGFSKT